MNEAGFADHLRTIDAAIEKHGWHVIRTIGEHLPWDRLGRVAIETFEGEPGFVYFIAGAVGGVKVGFTKRPLVRLATMQLGSPIRLRIEALAVGGRGLEKEYHARFAAHRLHGEWFERHPDILAEISRLSLPSSEKDR